MMKCGSCRSSNADEYKKIVPGSNLFDTLKKLYADRPYNPKYAYFCNKCIDTATAKLALKITSIGDQANANSLTITTTTDGSTAESSHSSKDEFDEIVQSRRVFSNKGTPLFIPPNPIKRPNTTGTKPCPKRHKKSQQAESSDRLEGSVAQSDVSEQESSERFELADMAMSTPSNEEESLENSGASRPKSKSDSLSNKGASSGNVGNSFNLDDGGDDFMGDQNASGQQLSIPPNEEVSSTSSNQDKESRKETPRSSKEKRRTHPRRSLTEKSDSDRSPNENSRTQSHRSPAERRSSTSQPLRSLTGNSDTQPQPRRSTTEKSDTESDQLPKDKRPKEPQRSAIDTTQKESGPAVSGTKTTARTGHNDSTSSDDGSISTMAPPARSPRIRQPASNFPADLRDYFKRTDVHPNFMDRSLGG